MKTGNEYADQFGRLYARIPKAVFAAVAFSFMSGAGEDVERGITEFLNEWRVLHENGIVPQKPPKGSA